MNSSNRLLRRRLALAVALPFAMSACVVLVQQRQVEELPPTEPVEVQSPVRVFLAEAFSYSISPLLEGRDVDELSASADAAGMVRLEIRNEALETHFINPLENPDGILAQND